MPCKNYIQMSKLQFEAKWLKDSRELLEGRKITLVRFMTEEEAEALGWDSRPIVLQLDDGNVVFPARDPEGNDGGVLYTNDKELLVIPSMR